MRAHVFVADLEQPVLDAPDRHHVERVLRLRVGDAISASDGVGGWRACRLGAGGQLEPDGPVVVSPGPQPSITVGFALTKGERPELAVQKLTEVGVDVIAPFVADRSVARWDDDRAAGRIVRLRKVAREAAMQCRRTWLPTVSEVVSFDAVVAAGGAQLALAQAGGSPPSLARPTVLVGPEGGWSPAELARELPTVALGAHVLRAETAAVVAGAVLGALRAGLAVGA